MSGVSYIVKEPLRSTLLREWGISDRVVQLGSEDDGQKFHSLIAEECMAPYQSSDPQQRSIGVLVGIYEVIGGGALAARKAADGTVEFVRFSVEAPQEAEVQARSELGLWYRLFDSLSSSEFASDAELRLAARAAGFPLIDDVFARHASGERLKDAIARIEAPGRA